MDIIKTIINFYTSLNPLERTLLIVFTALFITSIVFVVIYKISLWWIKQKKKAELEAQEKFNRNIEKRKQAEDAKRSFALRYPSLNNPTLNSLTGFYNFMLSGDPGTGKSLTASFLAKWFNKRQEKIDRKNYKEDTIFNAKYLAEKEFLKSKKLLNVSANFALRDPNTGFVARDVKKVLTQQEKDYKHAVNIFDETHDDTEVSKKGSFKNMRGENYVINQMSSSQQNHRRWAESRNIFCDQSGDHVNTDIRASGFFYIRMLGVVKWIAKRGQKIMKRKFKINSLLWPGFIFAKPRAAMRENLFLKYDVIVLDPKTNKQTKISYRFLKPKIKAFFKLFLPREWANMFAWALKKKTIYKEISREYTRFELSMLIRNELKQIEIGHKDKYDYDTHEGSDDYALKFDSEGKLKPQYERKESNG